MTGLRVKSLLSVEMPNFTGAVCREHDPEVWFPDTQEGVAAARRLCATCPILRQCADWAEKIGATEGVFASVLMPPVSSSSRLVREQAEAQLRIVAATGRAAGEGRRKRQAGLTSDAVFRQQVAALRAEGLSWERIAVRLDAPRETVRRAYDLHIGQAVAS